MEWTDLQINLAKDLGILSIDHDLVLTFISVDMGYSSNDIQIQDKKFCEQDLSQQAKVE